MKLNCTTTVCTVSMIKRGAFLKTIYQGRQTLNSGAPESLKKMIETKKENTVKI